MPHEGNLLQAAVVFLLAAVLTVPLAKRLQAACNEDSSLNGLVLLDLLAADTLYSLDRYDGELDRFFARHRGQANPV